MNDDGVIVGLENPQADADFISEMMKARLDPVPEVQLIPVSYTHLLVTIIILALIFDYINGFHDAANSIARCV